MKQKENKSPEKKENAGLFTHKDNSKESNDKFNSLNSSLNDLTRRIRISEERFGNLNRRNQLSDQNSITQFKKVNTDFRTLGDEIMEIKKSMEKIKSTMDLMIKELKLTAKKEEVNVLQRYINLWEPVNYVTQSEVEKVVKRILDEKPKVSKSKSL